MYVDHSTLPPLNSFQIYPLCYPPNVVFSFQVYNLQFVLPAYSLVSGHLPEHGRPISGNTLKENSFFLSSAMNC